MGIFSVKDEEEEKTYQDLLVNIKGHHCCEIVTAKLISWNHSCAFSLIDQCIR